MGKYFSNDSNFSQFDITDENSIDVTKVSPNNAVISESLDDDTIELLSSKYAALKQNISDEDLNIVKVHKEIQEINNIVENYSEETKKEIKNQFNVFGPAELMGKMNQIMFMMMNLNDRLISIEGAIKNQPVEKPKSQTINDPRDLINIDKSLNRLEQTNNIPSIDDIKIQLEKIKSGKVPVSIPDEDYIDKSVNLEEIFPDLEDEAYQAAYSAMKIKQKTQSETTPVSPIAMKHITGF